MKLEREFGACVVQKVKQNVSQSPKINKYFIAENNSKSNEIATDLEEGQTESKGKIHWHEIKTKTIFLVESGGVCVQIEITDQDITKVTTKIKINSNLFFVSSPLTLLLLVLVEVMEKKMKLLLLGREIGHYVAQKVETNLKFV